MLINLFFVALLLSLCQCGEIYISSSGADTSDCGSLQSPCETIDWGYTLCKGNCTIYLIATQDGQVFQLNDGGIIIDGTISLSLSAYNYTDVYNAPIINMNNVSRAFTLHDFATLSLSGISVISGLFSEGGGVILLNGTNTLDIDNCLFLLNQAESAQGGVIYSVSSSSISITNSLFYNNTASQGGVIYMIGGALSAKATSFNFNNAETASAIYATDSSQLYFEDCVFQENNAGEDAGAIYVSNSQLTANNVYFKVNTATVDAGALFLTGSQTKVVIDNSRFESNLAMNGNGGAVFCENGADMQATNTTFEQNKGDTGGAISVTSSGAFVLLFECTVSSNEAGTGGGLYLVHQGSANIQNTQVTGNVAGDGGGAFLKYNGVLSAFYSSISGNTAESAGGGVYCSGSTLVFNETKLENNMQFTPPTEDLFCYSSCSIDTYPSNSTGYVDPTWVSSCESQSGDDSSNSFLPFWAVILISVSIILAIFGLIASIVWCLWRGQFSTKSESVELLSDYDNEQ